MLTPTYRWLEGSGLAFGAPGTEPFWTSSEKDAVGTACSVSSRIWYTVSHGILNEIYHPTIDRPQIRDMQLIITDGKTFLHEEKRDLIKSFEYIDPDALAVRYVNSDPEGRYSVIKDIISDPFHPVVLIHVRLEGDATLLPNLKVYALLAPHLDGGGYGNSARALDVAGKKVLVAWKHKTSLALAVDCGFHRVSCGYVGQSDGWQDLHRHMKMNWEFGSALDGNIAVMGELPAKREFTLAIGFGESPHAALSEAVGSLSTPFKKHLKQFMDQWYRTTSPKKLGAAAGDAGMLLQTSNNVLLAHEDKTFAGAFIASASIPWGHAKGDDDLGGYHLVWTRDMIQTVTALLASGRMETALRALVYLACTQSPDGGFAQNFWIDGRPYWTGMQLDEVGFPIILAWRLWKLNGLGSFDVLPFIERAASFILRHAPVTQQERWEEASGYSPSTLAVVVSSLICAADILRAHGKPKHAQFLEEHADWIEGHIEDWTVTTKGILHPEVKRHYMRVRPPECGSSYSNEGCGCEILRLANQPPGSKYDYEAREIIDAGFLELVRYGIRRADDPLIVDSVKVVDHVLKVDLPQGPCWKRYNHDGYGPTSEGGPFLKWGVGRPWPLLIGERAHYELAAGRDPRPLIRTMEAFATKGHLLPEQVWDEEDRPDLGLFQGKPAGAAVPLVWAHAEYLKLLRSTFDGKVFDRIDPVYERYCTMHQPRLLEVFMIRRPVRSIAPGATLRVMAEKPFRVLWSTDDWQTVTTTTSTNLGSLGCYADMKASPGRQARVISFTLYWLEDSRWEGRNFDVRVETNANPDSFCGHPKDETLGEKVSAGRNGLLVPASPRQGSD